MDSGDLRGCRFNKYVKKTNQIGRRSATHAHVRVWLGTPANTSRLAFDGTIRIRVVQQRFIICRVLAVRVVVGGAQAEVDFWWVQARNRNQVVIDGRSGDKNHKADYL